MQRNTEKRQNIFDTAVSILYRALPKPSPFMVPLNASWMIFERFVPHVMNIHQVFSRSTPRIRSTQMFAELLCSTGAYLFERGLRDPGLSILETAQVICQDLSSSCENQRQILHRTSQPPRPNQPDSPSAMSLTILEANILAYAAGIYWKSGGLCDRRQAHIWGERILQLRQRRMKECSLDQLTISDHFLLSNAYNDFGLQLLSEQLYESAEDFHWQSLKIKRKFEAGNSVPGFEFAASNICIAFIRVAQGKFLEAVTLAREAANQGKEAGSHTFEYHLAVVLFNTGAYEESEKIHEAVLAARLKALKTNEETLLSYFAVAQCRLQRRKFEEALSATLLSAWSNITANSMTGISWRIASATAVSLNGRQNVFCERSISNLSF